ncbi:hypothetical protein GQ464_011890 [Rhodocaloribacter litoris]|uniref:hypothetical protein n=1 Tax=Rhodocaloribacter litoris TaxID=2558931 RepID=UPI00141EFDFC|nr:hypothetical protein [Rhodocaloribacter litoris]QXD14156.1 hypothetical protein GQ464_011890 [Rhodocaloribacter litoris]
MKRRYLMPAVLLFLGVVTACDSFVEDVDNPIDSINDDQLTTESQVPFLIKGIQSRFSTTYDRLAVHAGGLSDELFFDQRVPNATFPTFQEFDEGDITLANNSNDGVYNDLGELRFFADNLLTRIAEIQFEDADLQREAQFIGNFYGGVARYFYAAYYGLNPREGGGVISENPDNPGPFIPSAQMYALALEKLEAARGFADDYHTRVINTLVARIHLLQGNFTQARAAAQQGLQEGDDPFLTLFSVDNDNYWWSQAGPGRTQWVVDFRYRGYVDADPAEAARIPLQAIQGNDNPPTTFYRQARYVNREDPLPFATWQENTLMLAELDLRDGNTASALNRINAVRASHGLEPLASADMDVLILEREKELFTMGLRLLDQRRFNRWHLGPDTWQYFPITQNERNINPNF